MVRAERSTLGNYAFVERQHIDQEFNDRIDPIANIWDGSTFVSPISGVKRMDRYTQYYMKMELELAPGESRWY